MSHKEPRLRVAVSVGAVGVLLTACSGATASPGIVDSLGSAGGSSAGATSTSAAPAPILSHVHNVAVLGDATLHGTHQGLWSRSGSGSWTRLSEPPFDVMALTRSGDRLLASGHPGPQAPGPSDLGLMESLDGGRTWTPVSLGGEADFHRLAASGSTVLGITASGGSLLRSDDGGRSWTALGTAGLYDLALSPSDTSLVVATTPTGLVRSRDAGASFQRVAAAPRLALLAWSAATLYGLTPNGAVHASTDGGMTWEERGALAAVPSALAADGDLLAAWADGGLFRSADGGRSFDLLPI